MTVNNSEKIRSMMSFTEPNDFYFLQIVKRRKENKDLGRDKIPLKSHYIESLEHFDKILPEVIRLCDMENSRAYFRLNKRNFEKLSFPMLKAHIEYAATKSFRSIKDVFEHVAGKYHSDPDKTWLVDIDWKDTDIFEYNEILEYIKDAIEKAGRDNSVEIIPTKNGRHIICRPFNLQEFGKKYPKVDVHKDNPSILYCP